MAASQQIRLIALAIVSLLVGQPVFATMEQPGNEIQPRDPAQRFRDAQALRRSGDLDFALRELDRLRQDYPQDVDYVLARAQILVELGLDDLALDELAIGLMLAPDYEDIWILHLKLLKQQARKSTHTELDHFRQAAASQFPDALWWQNATESLSPWTLVVGGATEQLSNDQPGWNSQFAELHFEQNAAFHYQLQVSRDERFAGADTGLKLGTEYTYKSGWIAGIEWSTAVAPNFQPKYGYSGHVSKVLPDGWVVDLRYRRREYAMTAVSSVIGTAEKYIADFRIAYSLGMSQLSGSSNLANHTLTGNWYYDDESSVGVSLSSGREAESIGNNQVLETDVQSISLSGRQALNDRLGLHWWIGTHEQGDFYRRRFIGMALSIRI